MSQSIVEDLEEGEIPDDVVPEPVTIEKRKSLPRRYTLNHKKKISKHKKNCKHSFQNHKQKDEKDLKLHKKHRKECPKHYVSSYQKSPVVKFKDKREDCRKVSLSDGQPKLDFNKFSTKSAFKNFRSPPRKISKENSPRLDESDSFPKLLSEYKKTQSELNRHKNNNNLKDDKKHLSNISNRKIDAALSDENSIKPQPLDISSKLQSDDEDEEELRRQALASCANRPPIASQNSTANDACKENCLSDAGVIESDNYEVIDMDVDNENVEIVNDLFVIDTTPSYLSGGAEIQTPICSFNSNFEISDLNADFQINGFLPNLNIEPNGNFNPEIFNNLYSNIEQVIEDPHLKSSQLDDEFEEELLRAELIANMNSARLRNKNALIKQNSFQGSSPVCVEAQLSNSEKAFEEKRIVSIKNETNRQITTFNDRIISIENGADRQINTFNDRIISIENGTDRQITTFNDRIISIENGTDRQINTFNDRIISIKNGTDRQINSFDDRIISIENGTDRQINSFNDRIISIENGTDRQINTFNDRIISIENENPKESGFKEERTVSIVSEIPENKNSLSKTRSVFTVNPKKDFLNAADSPVRKSVDIQVKLNVQSNTNSVVSSSVITLPQERIVISLNNDSSSDDSDQDDDTLKEDPDKKSVVASLEALITNARHESDEKKDSTKNSSNSSDVVSCLSKAQQEEYNSLRKILARKQPFFIQPPPPKKIIPNAENSELFLLKKKLQIAKRNLEKEKTLMNNTMKEVAKKKRSYVASKLKTQLLKEQLLAAEKIRKSDLQLWTKCTSEFQTLKKSVTKREAIIEMLQQKINTLFSDFGLNEIPSVSKIPSDHNYNLSI